MAGALTCPEFRAEVVLDWYREEDARDLRRSEFNDFVENMACLNALEGKMWKSVKSWKLEKINHNIVLN